MPENIQTIASLHHLLNYDACKYTNVETQLKNCLPDWIRQAESLQLKVVLQKYLDFVQENLQKIESFFAEEDISLMSIPSRVMRSFIEEAKEKISMCTDAAIRDACLLACVQSINHFKISMYGTAAAFAVALGMEKQAAVFHEREVKEKQVDDRLSQLAEHEINSKALHPFILEK